MSPQLILPPLADPDSMVTLDRYLVPVGAALKAGDPVAVVYSDRFEWLVPATAGGTVAAVIAPAGSQLEPGAALLELSADGAADAPAEPAGGATTSGPRRVATPVARRVAAVHALDLDTIPGAGPGGRIMRADAVAAAGVLYPQPSASEPVAVPAPADIAAPLAAPATWPPALRCDSAVPLALTAAEIDLSAVLAAQASAAERASRRRAAIEPIAAIAAAVAGALVAHRDLNAAWTDDGIVRWGRVTLGVERAAGWATVARAAELSSAGMARALEGGHTDAPAPTFWIAVGDAWWGEGALPPYGATLHVGGVRRHPAVVATPGGETIAIRPCCLLTLAYDARIVAQPAADAFLATVRQRLEQFPAL